MFLHIKLSHIVFSLIVLITNADNSDSMVFLIDKDINCKSTNPKLTDLNCEQWKKLMIVTGNNAITCKKDNSLNIKTGEPLYQCGPTILREKYKKVVTSLSFEKNDNKKITGINVLVHHKETITNTEQSKYFVWLFITIIIASIICICFLNPPDSEAIDNGDIALWWLLTDRTNSENDFWDSCSATSYGFSMCS